MKIGFIGAGNMAKAMIGGILGEKLVGVDAVMASDKAEETLQAVKDTYGIAVTNDNCEVVAFADVLILAVKPIYMEGVLNEIKDAINEKQIIVTLAPGKTLDWIGKILCEEKKIKIIRTMPNTPALVGEGMAALCPNGFVQDADLETVKRIFGSFGRTAVVSEHMIDVVTGVSGSGPAYVFLFIEALADAAVREGMPRAQAYEFAAQTVYGSAKMVLETGKHPGELKDMVCSPGGTTIEAVRVLEKEGFRSATMEAVIACVDKARSL